MEGTAATAAAGVVPAVCAATELAGLVFAAGVTADAVAGLGLAATGFGADWLGRADVERRADPDLAVGLTGPSVCLVEFPPPMCGAELVVEPCGLPVASWLEPSSAQATAVPLVSAAQMPKAPANPPTPHRPALTVIVSVYATAVRGAAEMTRLCKRRLCRPAGEWPR